MEEKEITPDEFLRIFRELKVMRAECMILKEENGALYRMVEAAESSMKRDLARCRAAGESPEKTLYSRWLKDLGLIRELKERKRNL